MLLFAGTDELGLVLVGGGSSGGDWTAGENEEGGRSRLVVGWGIGRGDPEGDSVEWRRGIGRMGQLS